MKQNTKISILDNLGIRRNATIEVGANGSHESGLLLDANAIEKLTENKIASLGLLTNTVPTKISDLTDDVGILTSYTEIDPTVPQWARESTKPTYTAQEVGAATISDVETAIANIVNQAPDTLNTLNELASALGNDPNFATTISNQIGAKYTKPNTGIPASDLADGVIPTSLPASDVSAWAKAATKPAYTLAEVGASMSVVAINADTSSVCGITGAGNSGKTETIIYTNSGISDLTVTVPTTNIQTPDGEPIELTCHGRGYCEVNYINISGVIYARGI